MLKVPTIVSLHAQSCKMHWGSLQNERLRGPKTVNLVKMVLEKYFPVFHFHGGRISSFPTLRLNF